MVRKCIVCNASQKGHSPLSFHRFPKNEEMRQKWIEACGLENTVVKLTTIVCSKHFNEDSFDSSVWPTNRLHLSAVPHPLIKKHKSAQATSMDIPMDNGHAPIVVVTSTSNTSTIMPKLTKETSSTVSFEIETNKSPSPCTKNLEIDSLGHTSDFKLVPIVINTPPKQVRYVGDLNVTHFSSPRDAARNLELVKSSLEKQRKTIKTLRVQKKRLEHRIEILKDLLGFSDIGESP